MTLGDTISEDQAKQSTVSKMKEDLFPTQDSPSRGIKIIEDKETTSSSTNEKGDQFVEKYKNKTAIGSDDINPKMSSWQKDVGSFEGKSGFGSDDLSGKPVRKSSGGGIFEVIKDL